MSEKVINNIAKKYVNIKKEVTEVMGGQVLEYEAKRILRQGIEQGSAITLIDMGKEMNYSQETILAKMMEKLNIT